MKPFCLQCGAEMMESREDIPYVSLPGTTILGAIVRRCACGESEHVIPQIEDLHSHLVGVLVKDGPRTYSPAEMKFLRAWLDMDRPLHERAFASRSQSFQHRLLFSLAFDKRPFASYVLEVRYDPPPFSGLPPADSDP